MASITTRVVVEVITDDGRAFTWQGVKENVAPDDTHGVGIVAMASLNLQAEEAAEGVETSGVGRRF